MSFTSLVAVFLFSTIYSFSQYSEWFECKVVPEEVEDFCVERLSSYGYNGPFTLESCEVQILDGSKYKIVYEDSMGVSRTVDLLRSVTGVITDITKPKPSSWFSIDDMPHDDPLILSVLKELTLRSNSVLSIQVRSILSVSKQRLHNGCNYRVVLELTVGDGEDGFIETVRGFESDGGFVSVVWEPKVRKKTRWRERIKEIDGNWEQYDFDW